MTQARGRIVSRAMQQVQAALEEVEELGGKLGCRICWMFDGAGEARHQWTAYDDIEDCLTFLCCMDFQ